LLAGRERRYGSKDAAEIWRAEVDFVEIVVEWDVEIDEVVSAGEAWMGGGGRREVERDWMRGRSCVH